MLSAAHDILMPDANEFQNSSDSSQNRTGYLIEYCNPIGTGAILLADVLPSLIVKLTAPFYIHLLSYRLKVCLVTLLSAASFIIVSLGGSHLISLSIFGIVLASIGAGLGEFTFLSLTAHFDKSQVSTWSSGTGAAGVAGSLSYAGLTAVHISPQTTLLIMLVVPCFLFLTYFMLLVKPVTVSHGFSEVAVTEEQEHLTAADMHHETHGDRLTDVLKSKLQIIKPLVKFMAALFLVYFAEYFINQALFELVYFDNIWLERVQQYRWYQVIYQIGVFISRSSVSLVQIPQVFVFPFFQFINVAVFVLQIYYHFITNIWIIFAVILFEGLLGGAAYVNSFYQISKKADAQHREFSMGVTCISDSFGITVAAAVAIPVHNYLCTLPCQQ